MSKKFQYNFTLQSQFQQLKQKNSELQQENNMLKQSIEQLIKVNNQLTQSIQELNNNNNMQNNQLLQERFQMLLNENNQLRDQLQQAELQKHNHKKQAENDDQTENLVNVLEELIESFKNIQLKYQSEIKELQENALKIYKQFEDKIIKIQQELSLKANTMQALSIQLNRKNQIIQTIEYKFNSIEKLMKTSRNITSHKPIESVDKVNYENKINEIKSTLEEKERVIKMYENLLASLKHKIMEKY